ncbi:MAG TPA: TrkH family potassium uptake protein, partial [Phycisphaerae bacterium]|nr:TrkH family potassium uptake protein [Phycisphaerae bacterium]
FGNAGFTCAIAIEYTIIVAMVLGGISYCVHFRLLMGGLRALWDSFEMRLFGLIMLVATAIVMTGHVQKGIEGGFSGYHDAFRHSLFQVVSLATTTGFGTKDISDAAYYSASAAQVFLLLMIVGGCVGSTSGGLKVLRIGVLFKMLHRQLQRLMNGSRAVQPVVVDGEVVDAEELRRISALFFGWMALLAAGALITTLVTDIGAFESISGMFSALGNIGPSHIPQGDYLALHPVVKIVYIFGMLAGRLEILPMLLLFKRASWR